MSNYHKLHLFVRCSQHQFAFSPDVQLRLIEQDVDVPGGTRLMESDTTLPGDKLHDPVETPAGKRESAPIFNVTLIPVNGATNNPISSNHHQTHQCSFEYSGSSDLLRYQVSGSRADFEDTRSGHVGVPKRLHGQDWSCPLGGSPQKPCYRNADLCDWCGRRWTAYSNPNKLGTRHGALPIFFVRAARFSLIFASDRSWIRGERSWRNATMFLKKSRLSVLRTST